MPFSEEEYKMCLEGLRSEDSDLRRESAEDLGYSEIEQSALELVKYLADQDKGVRDAVSNSLKKLNYQPVTYDLVEYLKNQQIDIRNYASDILISMQERSVPALIKMLKDPDHDVRKFSADILGLIKTKESISALIICLDDNEPNVSVSAIEALGNLGYVEAVDALINKAHRDPEQTAMVLDALGKIGSDKVNGFIEEAINHEDSITAFSAIETLGKIGTDKHLALLFSHLETREDFFSAPILLAIIRIVNRLKISLTTLPKLLTISSDILTSAFSEDEVSEEFSKNLINFEMIINLRFLQIYLKFLKKEAKIQLVNYLKNNYQPLFSEIVNLLLKDSDSWIVFKSCELVSVLKLNELSKQLIEILDCGDAMVEIGASKALGSLKSSEALPALEKLLKETYDDDVRKEVGFAIKLIKD